MAETEAPPQTQDPALAAPDQKFAPKTISGPFIQSLQSSLEPNVVSNPHQDNQSFTGWETPLGKSLGLASKFLAGLGQGRMMRALSEEKAKSDKMQRFVAMGESILTDDSVAPEDKAKFESEFRGALLGTVHSGLKDAEKQGGPHAPIIGALKKLVEGMAGGEVKSSAFDMKKIDSVMTNWAGYRGKLTENAATRRPQAENALRVAVQNAGQKFAKDNPGKEPTQEDIRKLIPPAYVTNVDTLGGKGDEIVKSSVEAFRKAPAMQEPPKPGSEDARRLEASEALKAERGAAPPGGSVPTAARANLQGIDLKQEQGQQQQRGEAPPIGKLTPAMEQYTNAFKLRSDPKEMMVNGKKMEVEYIRGENGIPSGFINSQTGEYLPKDVIPQSKDQGKNYVTKVMQEKGINGGKPFIAQQVDSGKWEPLKIGDKIMQPPDKQESGMEKTVKGLIMKEYNDYSKKDQDLTQRKTNALLGLDKEKVPDGQGGQRLLTAEEKAQRKSAIENEYGQLRKDAQRNTKNLMGSLGAVYGVSNVRPFMDQDAADNLDLDSDDAGGGTPKWFSDTNSAVDDFTK